MAQDGSAAQPADNSLRELDSQVRESRAMIEHMRAENAQSRTEMRELRQESQDTEASAPLVASLTNGASAPASEENAASLPATGDLGSRVQKLEESTQLLGLEN